MLKLSICIIARNEQAFLPNLLLDLKQQLYPHECTEIVLVDCGSTDKTRLIMEEFQKGNEDFYAVQVLDNPKYIQAAGWNVAIQNATGDVIARIDAHTKLPAEYSQKVMEHIESGEDVVGGIRPCLIENKTLWSDILLRTENSLFGSSINKTRRSQEKTYVKTMFHAAYKKEVFQKAGLFNENLLRTEDNEMHHRIREAGYKLCYDPQIISYQYARNSFKKMLKQKYGNGYWIGLTTGIDYKCFSLYHFIPLLFVLGIFATTLLAVFGIWQFATAMWGMYSLFAIINTIVSSMGVRFNPYCILMPFLFLSLHIVYGLGTLLGLIKMPFWLRRIKRKSEK